MTRAWQQWTWQKILREPLKDNIKEYFSSIKVKIKHPKLEK